jgi:hypothetical protein
MLDMAMGIQVDEMLGFQIARVPVNPNKPKVSLSTMRKEFDKEKPVDAPTPVRSIGSTQEPKYVRTVTAEASVQEGISLHDVAWIGNLIPSFIQRVTTSGTREAKQTLQLGKILGKWVGTGELTPGEEAFAKQQLIDIAKMIASMAVASAVTASAPAHAAASAVASGVTHIAQHGAVDLGLDALAVMLSKNFKFDFLKKVMHSLETDSGKAISHVEKKAAQAPQDAVDKQVNQQFQQAKMGFGGMSESIDYIEENRSRLKK